jgi:hypothetical protein
MMLSRSRQAISIDGSVAKNREKSEIKPILDERSYSPLHAGDVHSSSGIPQGKSLVVVPHPYVIVIAGSYIRRRDKGYLNTFSAKRCFDKVHVKSRKKIVSEDENRTSLRNVGSLVWDSSSL